MAYNSKIVGVLGGMGPETTIDFMAKVIAATPAARDQDHVHMIVDCNPKLPDRQQAILGNGADPGPAMATMAQRLEAAGADFLVMPCNTAHAFSACVTGAVRIPLLSIVDATVAACANIEPVGLLTTSACLASNIYQQAFAAIGRNPVLQNDDELALMTDLAYRIKAGEKGAAVRTSMLGLANALVARGAHAIVAACTEIPLLLDASMLDVPFIASTDVLARQTVAYARGQSQF